MSDLISIIIPVFNCEDYLRACVCSILQQTYKDFELILVDGGGTDTSGLICDEFATIDNRIKVIHKNNEGVSIARNKGIDIAKGNWLCFIDSDDTITPDYLEKLHPHNQETKHLDLILCNITDVYPNQISRKRPLSSTLVNDFKSDYSTLHSLLIGPVIKLYKASIIKTNKLYFPLA